MKGQHTKPSSPPDGGLKRQPEQARQLLKERARRLARPLADKEESEAALEVIEFRLAREHYALETGHVREVLTLKDLTPLPGTPDFFRGIVNVRGQILAVLDIKRFFDLPEEGITDLHHIIVLRGGGMEVGVLADAVAGVRRVALRDLQAGLPTLTGIRQEYLKGVTGGRLAVLDAAAILRDEKLIVHEEP